MSQHNILQAGVGGVLQDYIASPLMPLLKPNSEG